MAPTSLQAGDMAIVGFNFDNPNEFAFVVLNDINTGTEIKFTDKGWKSDGTFNSRENTFTWAAERNYTAGSVITISNSNLMLSSRGDQIIAYQGSEINPTLLYALNSQRKGWQAYATTHSSALPTGLTNGTTAIALDEIDNAVYNGPTTGTKAELLSAISDTANWSGSNTVRQDLSTLSTASFNITDASGGSGQTVFINEIHYDNAGGDVNEGIEVAGNAGTDLTGWSIELYNGKDGAVYRTIDLSGTIADQQNGFGTVFFAQPTNGVQNGSPDGIALIDNNNTVVQFLSYEGTLTATGGTAAGLTSTDIGVSETSSTPIGSSLQLTGTGTSYEQFTWSTAVASTYNRVNTGQNFGGGNSGSGGSGGSGGTGGTSNSTSIYTIQGTGLTSSLAGNGQSYTVRGVVVGDFQANNELDGFFIQDPTGDGNVSTSDGIFVYAPGSIDVREGDLVEVTGQVNEFFDKTQINNVSSLSVISSGNNIAATKVNLPFADASTLEKYEGMLIELPQNLTVTNTFNLGRYGEVTLSSGGRLFQPTNVVAPGAQANALQAKNDLNRLIVDDGSTVQNSDPLAYPGTGLTASNTLRAGDTVANVTGVLDYSFSNYRVQPTVEPNFVASNPRSNTAPNVGGTLKVASFNLLNYFNGDGIGGGFPTSRGADNFEEFQRQRDKTIDALVKLDSDIIGVVEVENDGYGSNSAIQDLVKGLNAAQSQYTYAFVDPGTSQLGGDQIAVGMIYRTDTVTPVGTAATLSTGAFADRNRQPLAQTFKQVGTEETFTVAVNHFKSKGGTGTGLDADLGDGQGNWNATRVAAAEDLVGWLNTNPTGVNDSDFLIVGDLNAYAKEDPITAIKNAGYTDLIDKYNANPYSYTFDGQFGYLDRALSSASLTSQVTGAAEWHVNADEPRILDYNTEFKSLGQINSLYNVDPFRTSDHDPLIVGLNLSSTVI